MATYVNLADTELDPDAPVTSRLAYAWRDNLVAVTEGAAGAPRIQDAALGSTVTAAGTAWVRNRLAVTAFGSVGSYALLGIDSDEVTANIPPGTTLAGSVLRYASAGVSTTTFTRPAGTWQIMGAVSATATTNPERISLFLRVS